VDGKRSQRSIGAGLMLMVIAVLATIGTVAIGISYRNNEQRAARYAADPSCQSSLVVRSPAAPVGLCTTELATITALWLHRNRGTRYYRLAMLTTSRVIDSLDLKGENDKAVWNAARVGSSITVQRFAYPATERRRVTLVAVNGLNAQTAWNPAWQEKNAKVGMWFCGIAALLSMAGLLLVRARRATT
jgi:hypothetical protein